MSSPCKERLNAYQRWAVYSDAFCVPMPTAGFTMHAMRTTCLAQVDGKLEETFPTSKDASDYIIFHKGAAQRLQSLEEFALP